MRVRQLLRAQHINLQNAVLCEKRCLKNHALYVILKYDDVNHFRNRSAYELFTKFMLVLSK